MFSSSLSKVYFRLVCVAFIWGATYITAKIVATSIPPLVGATLRFFIAGVLLVAVAFKVEKGLPRLNRSSLLATMGLGISGIFLYNVFFFSALTQLEAGRSSLFVALSPAVTAVVASFLFKERLGGLRWLGVAIALSGALIVITKGNPLSLVDGTSSAGIGELMMLGTVASWTTYTLIGRRVSTDLSSIATTTYAVLWGLLFLIILSFSQLKEMNWGSVSLSVWASLFFMGAIATVLAFVWFLDGVRTLGPSRAAVFNNLVPVFGVLLASLTIGEAILPSMMIGGALGIIGVSLTNSSKATTALEVPPSADLG